jgi:hypothetical protein
VENGVPAATCATAASASVWLAYSATVKHAVSNSAAWLAKYRCKAADEGPTPAASSSIRLTVASNFTLVSTKDAGIVSSTSLAVRAVVPDPQAYFELATSDRMAVIWPFNSVRAVARSCGVSRRCCRAASSNTS